MKPSLLLAVLSLLGLLLPGAGHAASVTFTTGVFNIGERSSHVDPASTGTAVASTQGSGGNPFSYRQVSLTVAPNQAVVDVELWSQAVYDPSLQGAVASVSLSYDVSRVQTSNLGATQIAKGIAVEQDGVIHKHLAGVTALAAPTWDSLSLADIVPLFPLVDWAGGSAITFGFFDSVATGGTGFTIVGGYDNFSVTVTTVPLPAAFWLLATAMLGLPVRSLTRRLVRNGVG